MELAFVCIHSSQKFYETVFTLWVVDFDTFYFFSILPFHATPSY